MWLISTILVLPDKEKTLDEEETKAEGQKEGEAEQKCEEELPDNPPCAEEQEPLGGQVVLSGMLRIALSVRAVAGRVREDCRLHEP